MKSKLASNPAKKILCLALCAIMLIAMLPVMTTAAHAETIAYEPGTIYVEYLDADTGAQITDPTLIRYTDVGSGVKEFSVPRLVGYQNSIVVCSVNGQTASDNVMISYGTSTVESTWRKELYSMVGSRIMYNFENENEWARYQIFYTKDDPRAANGYVQIQGFTGPDPAAWTEFYYYDDMTSGEYSIDLNKPGYRIVGGYDGTTDIDIEIPANGILTGTMAQGDKIYFDVMYEEDNSAASFNAVLLLNENASVPDATISYSIAPGTGIAAVPGTSMAVLAPSADTGVTGTPTISNAVFAPGDATVTSVDGVIIDAGEKAVVKPISIDFSNVTFAQPGIFRYVISEPSSGNNMTYDTQLNDTTNGTRYQRVLDVYVVRNAEDEYEIGGFVLHEVAGAVNEGETTAADKSSGFVNEYNTTGLTLECQVEGNQSSIDKYFAYTITMQNPGNSAFNVSADWSNASGAQNPVANPATSYTNEAITAANTNEWTSNADGSMSKTIYLKDGQKVALDGIPVGTSYSVTVAEEDYGPSWVVGSDNASNDATGNRTLNAVEDVVFTLTREGVVPTGVALSILPGVILMGAAAAFFFVMKNRKREEGANA